jgi:RNA polymerase sigma-70 factor (ECF subfamily)
MELDQLSPGVALRDGTGGGVVALRSGCASDEPIAAGQRPSADEARLRELYREHAGALLGYVRRLVKGDVAQAEDVVQETFLRAWRHPDALRPNRRGRAQARAWLLTVARHVVIDSERRRQSRPHEVALLTGTEPAAEDPAFEQVLAGWQIADALDALSPKHRAVIVELYYRDASVAEAACTLGVPEGTVKSRAYYALRELRAACAERGILP